MASIAQFALATILATPLLQAQKDSPGAMDLLRQMSQHYASATSWYIEAKEEHSFENEYCSESQETTMLGAESGRKYHYEAHSHGSAVHISDGITAWDFHPDKEEYRKQPAPAGPDFSSQSSYPAEAVVVQAVGLRKYFAELASHYNSATRLPDEVLHSTGYDVPCYVVRVTAADRKDPTSFGESATETLWIDRKTGVVWERRQHDDSFILSASSRTPVTVNSFTRYSTVQLGTTVPETLFHFDPPASAASVAQFSEFRLRLDMTGLPAPDVQLVSADGSVVPLSSFRGKPVLLDFWSIHCKPCVEGMPKIDEIAKKTAANGLVVLSVNEDLLMGVREEEEKKKAIDFFAQHNYTWPDFFDEGTVHQSFNMLALPHLVLIDSQGTIVYFRGDQDELLTAIASLGPQYEFLRPVPKPQDSCAIAAKQIPPN